MDHQASIFEPRSSFAPVRGSAIARTHRVVRERAMALQARRSYVRSLMAPLAVCSALLILTATALWSGLYQYEAVEADVAALASNDLVNHILVTLLWFVPVSLILLAAVWLRRVRQGGDDRGTTL